MTTLLISTAAILFVASWYKQTHFGDAKIDEILFYFANGIANGQSSSVTDAVWAGLPYAVGLAVLMTLPILPPVYRLLTRAVAKIMALLRLLLHRPSKQQTVRPDQWRYRVLYACALLVMASWQLLQSFSIPAYVYALTQSTDLYETHYVDPAKARLHFPAKKRNLIYIYLESVENTVMSRANGGQMDQSRMPELEQLALENLSFSHRDSGLGGALPASGTTWTVGGLTATSAGVPLKDGGLLGRDRNSLGEFRHFMPGAVTLGQLLERAGYNQSFIMGSDAAFGGRDKLLKQHGNYTIIDHPSQQAAGRLPTDHYKVWWGYEDKKLFQFAKQEATRLAAQDKPFNLQLLTVDTHFTDGWMDETCPQPFADQYSNVHACSSRQVAAFIQWLKEQPFYDNTTVIITGDHLGMQTDYYHRHTSDKNYQRTIFNTILNSAKQPRRRTNRLFSSFDMYPTTLAAMGVTIEGERLGLGVNLFSDKQTLVEQFGSIDALNAELDKRSSFYERQIIAGPPRRLQ